MLPLHKVSNLSMLGFKKEKIVDLRSNTVFGYEILSTSAQNGHWLRKDMRTMSVVREIRALVPDGLFNLNLSTASIVCVNESLIEMAADACGKGNLVIEWIEDNDSVPMVFMASKILKNWRSKYNIKIAIDDYGSGQDGMERFLLTNPDMLKVDGKLLVKARSDASYQRAISTITKWCKEEGSVPVFEWIESHADLLLAKNLGATLGQGYFFK